MCLSEQRKLWVGRDEGEVGGGLKVLQVTTPLVDPLLLEVQQGLRGDP